MRARMILVRSADRAHVATAVMILVVMALTPSRSSAEAVEPEGTPYRLWLGPDIAVITAGFVLWVTPTITIHNQIHGPACSPDPCNRDDINAAERWAVDLHDVNARYASDAIFYALPPLWLALELAQVGFHKPKAFFTDVALLAETLSWSGAIDEIFRRAVHRPRPYTYAAGVYPDRRNDGEAGFSYYSGHTSALFAFSVFTAYTVSLRHPGSRWQWPVWVGLMALSTAEGVLRVLSGDHFPSDVIAGALMGSAIGLFVPMVHKRVAKSPVLSSLSLIPSQHEGVTSFTLGGRF